MMFTVSRPSSMWSSVAMVRASMIGCISPQRTAASMLIFVRHLPAGGHEAQRVLPDLVGRRAQDVAEALASASFRMAEQCAQDDRRSPSGTPRNR
jgi:hypothetical protein